MKPLLLILLLSLTQTDELRIRYEKIEDRTNISTKPKDVGGGKIIRVYAFFNHSGQQLTSPVNQVGLVFEAYSPNWRFLYNDQLFILADDVRLTFPTPKREPRFTRGTNVLERLIFLVTSEQLATIANAKSVEVKLGSEKFKFTDGTLKALRQLEAAMNPNERTQVR